MTIFDQYKKAKEAAGEALLLFRVGDFYEVFYDDATDAAKLLGLSLTTRGKGDAAVPMAGFPYQQLDQMLAKIIGGGRRAAVCEQLVDVREGKTKTVPLPKQITSARYWEAQRELF